MPDLHIYFEEVISPARENFEEQNKVLQPPILIIIIIIIIITVNVYCNYIV